MANVGLDQADEVTYSIRTFVVDSENCVFRLPNTKFGAMLEDPKSYPLLRFAGQRARMAEAVVELRDRVPCRIVQLGYEMVQFDTLGQFDRQAFDRQNAAVMDAFMDLSEKSNGAVVEAGSRFIVRGSRWRPTVPLERYIRQAALGEVKCKRL